MDQNTEKNMSLDNPNTTFSVVVNSEEQYSIWPEYKDIPAGWNEAGKQGNKEECLSWIKDNWTDMRPKSLQDAMANQ